MTTLRPGLELLQIKEWQPKHENFKQKFRNPRSYKLRNPFPNRAPIERYRATTKNMQFIIGDAINRKLEIKALGKGWSFTKIGVGKNGIVDTLALRLSFRIGKNLLHNDFLKQGHVSDDVWFLQCGNSVRAINGVLEKKRKSKRSILASGASNGQTIVGATQTGTHGAAFTVGSVHDAIVGLHIVTGPDRHVYIEKKSNRIVHPQFAKALRVNEHIVDDDIFNAAVVGLGAFGIIHGVMLRTEPIFLLEKYISQTSLTKSVKQGFDTLDFSKFALRNPKHPKGELYHFQALINPYKTGPRQGGIQLMYMYKRPYGNYKPKTLKERGLTYGDDTLGVLNGVLSVLPPIIDRLAVQLAVNLAVNGLYDPNADYPWIGTMGETFTYTSLKGKTASCAFGLDVTNTSKAVDIILDTIKKKTPFFGVISLRYVKGSDATLAFTKFPVTCVLELDGVDTRKTRNFYMDIGKLLHKNKIPFTLHWGKINDYMQKNPLDKFFSKSQIDSWKDARELVFADKKAKRVFNNQFLRKFKLA